jgi:nucleotide-binding universal stress UspA family protein
LVVEEGTDGRFPCGTQNPVISRGFMDTLISIRELPYSEPTVRFGGVISDLTGSPITLMTVVKDETDKAEAEEWMEAARALLDAPEVTIKVRKGNVLKQILKESQSNNYGMIIVGTHELKFLKALLGTVTGKVADKAGKSVLVVKQYRPSLKKILLAVGGQQNNKTVVKEGAKLALKSGAAVTVLHVTAPVPSMFTGLEQIEETLDEMLQTDTPIAQYLRWSAKYLDKKGVSGDIEIRHGSASDEIVREARQGNYDLLVIGAALALGPLRRLLVDPIASHVIERSPCSILTVR